jgi:hypothetical protein
VDQEFPPGLERWIAADVIFGVCAITLAFALRKFVLLFLAAASIWFIVLFALYVRWWRTRDRLVPGWRKIYRGIALLTGFLIALAAYYLIIRLDPTLR